MIIQFSFSNYKSFKDRAVLNFTASNYDKDTRENDNVIHLEDHNLRILKSSVIYGANASGKSKFIEAITFFRSFIIGSSKESQKGEPIKVEPFLLNDITAAKPSEFEIVFLLEGVMYRYGFEANQKEIIAEWLYSRPKTKEFELFYRDLQDITYNEKKLSKAVPLIKAGLIRNNSLLLSVLAQFNDVTASAVLSYISSLKCISGLNENEYKNNSLDKVKEDPIKKEQILDFLKSADLGIEDIRFEDIYDHLPSDEGDEQITRIRKEMHEIREKLQKIDPHLLSTIKTKHKIYNDQNLPAGFIEFRMNSEESQGTQKYFYLAGIIIDALENGQVLIVDELDSKLHPNLVCKIVSLFNSEITNPNCAQLIFNTHDTNLLSSGLFRRDQIWFVAKDEYANSKLYSLGDFKTDTVRKNESFEENYIKGKYGAVPYLGDFDEITRKILAEDGKKK